MNITWEKVENAGVEIRHWLKSAGLPARVALTLLGAGLLGLSAQIKIPLPWTPVPITGETLTVLVLGVLLGAGTGALSTVSYVLLGAAGIPWFAGARGGMAALSGVTGGYLFGFILAAFFTGFMYERCHRARSLTGMLTLFLVADFLLIHPAGLIWLGHVTGIHEPAQLLAMGTLPFISGDLLKIAAAAAVCRAISHRAG